MATVSSINFNNSYGFCNYAEYNKSSVAKKKPYPDYSEDYLHNEIENDEWRYSNERRAERKRQREKEIETFKQRLIAGLAALSIAVGGIGYVASVNKNNNDNKTPNDTIDLQIVLEKPLADIENLTTTESQLNADEIIKEPEIPNSQVQSAYDKITNAIDTFSKDIGQDGLSLIRQRVAEIGNDKVDVLDVLKVLAIESDGRVYDSNGNYLVSYTGEAFGPFQLTPDTVDYLNNYFSLDGGKKLDIMNPFDNLDACIYNLRFLKYKKTNDLEEKGSFPNGVSNVNEAVFWGYHDGAWATKVTDYGKDYIEKYRNLTVIDDYPEIVNYVTQYYE